MSDDKIEEIRARHQEVPNGNFSIAAISLAHADRAILLAEVDRQRAEIEKLRAEIDGLEAELSLMKSGFEIAYRAMGDKP